MKQRGSVPERAQAALFLGSSQQIAKFELRTSVRETMDSPSFGSCLSRSLVRTLAVALALGLAGCATVALDRSKVEPLKAVEVVRVTTPPLHVLTFMQAMVNTPAVGAGLIPAAIAEAQGNTLISSPAIPDLGALVSDGLRAKLPAQAPWWPKMIEGPQGAVPKTYLHQSGYWLRVEVEKLEVAPPPLRTVFAVVNVSLRTPTNEPIWVEREAFSGVVHGGEKIDVDRIPGDLTQVRREVERAAHWLVDQIAANVR